MGSSTPGRTFFSFLADPGVKSHAARPDPSPSILGTVCIALLVAISYYVGAKIGFLFKPAETPISTFWPPNAILLAALLLTPRRVWWALILAVLPAHLLVEFPAGVPMARALGWFARESGRGFARRHLYWTFQETGADCSAASGPGYFPDIWRRRRSVDDFISGCCGGAPDRA